MGNTIEDKIQLYTKAVEDSVITSTEKSELERIGITEELQAKL